MNANSIITEAGLVTQYGLCLASGYSLVPDSPTLALIAGIAIGLGYGYLKQIIIKPKSTDLMNNYTIALTEWVTEGKDGSIELYRASNTAYTSIRRASKELGIPRSTIHRFLKSGNLDRKMVYRNRDKNETMYLTFNKLSK